ncbi:MAG: hypothetical protein K0R39_1582 [Symbiobacteriaceae bacterium]|nr:hypothetical protein [Symbiobacteriaceae bacterium]
MQQDSTQTPVQGALFYTAKVLLLGTVGLTIQGSFGSFGSIVNQVLFNVVLALGFVLYDHSPVRSAFRLRRISTLDAVKAAGLGLVALALLQVLGVLLSMVVERAGGALPEYYNFSRTPFVLALVTHAVTPAICEELAYRGFLQHALSPLGARAAVLVTALLFGATHFSLIRLVPLVLLGLMFGEVVRRSGSVYTSMIMHLVNNGAVLALTYYGAGIPSLGALGLPVLGGLALVLGLTAWGLVRSFGTIQGGGATVTEPGRAEPGGGAGRPSIMAFVAVLVPAVLLYAYAVSSELTAVFGRTP